MSKFKPQPPIIHIPSFTEYKLSTGEFRLELLELELSRPFGMLDEWYYFTDTEGWGKILWDLTFNSSLYKADRFDCENFALKAMSVCAERYGLNTFGVVIGDTPQGRHGFNIFFTGKKFLLWEPNDGYPQAGMPFKIGDFGYIPDMVLI